MTDIGIILLAALAIVLGFLGYRWWSSRKPRGWYFGPIVNGRNYSIGMPEKPTPTALGIFVFDLPVSPNEIDYMMGGPVEGLASASAVVMNWRIEADEGVEIIASEAPDHPATVSLCIHRKGDNWSASKGNMDFYRWYAPSALVQEAKPGSYTVTVPLDDPSWGSVWGVKAGVFPADFRAALENAECISITFGGAGGRGHGVYASGPARFFLESFEYVN